MIIPGNGNADMSEIWRPYVKRELEKLGLTVIAKNMPDPDLARQKYWLPFMKEQIEGDENAILIGHSSGALAAMKYAEEHKLEGIVIVAAAHTDLGDDKEKASGYFDEPWQWEKMKNNTKWIIQFASTNDPYIPIEEAHHVRDHLNAEYYEYPDQGHFSSDINKTEFPELIEAMKRKLNIS